MCLRRRAPTDDRRSAGIEMTCWACTPGIPTSAKPTGEASSWIFFEAPVKLVAAMVMRSVVKV